MILKRALLPATLLLCALSLWTCNGDEAPPAEMLTLTSAYVGLYQLDVGDPAANDSAPTDKSVILAFSAALNTTTAQTAITLKEKATGVPLPLSSMTFFDNNHSVHALPQDQLLENRTYIIEISNLLKGADNESFSATSLEFTTAVGSLSVIEWRINGELAQPENRITGVPIDNVEIEMVFSDPIDASTMVQANVQLISPQGAVSTNLALSVDQQTVTLVPDENLAGLSKYTLVLSNLAGTNGEVFQPQQLVFYSAIDAEPDFPMITDDALLTLVQEQTFRYFWDFAHPASGMARERNTSGDLVTSGGSGFGISALAVGIERNFITRAQGLDRMDRILEFLETADRFHGAWPHWMNGNTGEVIPFSPNDNGGDLVETALLVQGLLTFRQYLDDGVQEEAALIGRINALWHSVEWDWYTRGGQDVLYWHWSPDKEWTMNHRINGYNEALIVYVLAASSPDHSIDASVYHQGWAGNGAIANGNTYYGIELPLGSDYGGPLFFAHYSFLGLDPRNLADVYAGYWTQNVNHSRINHAYSIANPLNYVGYSESNWGLTASDSHEGYSAHSPTNDLGVITPTAALSSFPYTPEESMKALKFFYYTLGDRLWGEYGFYDAFNLTEGWVADSYLAIDQGPIIIMIENYRTGLLWELFMSAPEVQTGLDKLSFTY